VKRQKIIDETLIKLIRSFLNHVEVIENSSVLAELDDFENSDQLYEDFINVQKHILDSEK